MSAYYNENDPFAAQWLRNLIAAGHIAPGDVDERSIKDVQPDDVRGYAQAHFFAGIGGWSLAARLAGLADDEPIWTGSCPCQPFSVAGKGAAQQDERHLWPTFFGLIRAVRPDVVMGEQVAAAVGRDWLDGVCSDLESVGYACRAAVVPACAVDAPHRRDRLWFVADAGSGGVRVKSGRIGGARMPGPRIHSDDRAHDALADTSSERGDRRRAPSGEAGRRFAEDHSCGAVGYARSSGLAIGPGTTNERSSVRLEGPAFAAADNRSAWGTAAWLAGADGKARRVPEPSIRLLAHGVPARVGRLRAYGNAIVPQVAAEVIAAFLETRSAA